MRKLLALTLFGFFTLSALNLTARPVHRAAAKTQQEKAKKKMKEMAKIIKQLAIRVTKLEAKLGIKNQESIALNQAANELNEEN